MNKRQHKKKKHHFLIPVVIILAALIIFYIGTLIDVSEYEISSPKIPQAFDGFRIVQLSDLHGAEFGKANEKLYSAVSRARPDIIAITGDMTDAETDISYAREVVSHLTEIAPVYYVTGNHEWSVASGGRTSVWSSDNIGKLAEIFEDEGVTFLRGDIEELERGGESIVIAGLDDPNGYADLGTTAGLLYDIRDGYGDKFSVLLYHRNNALDKIAGSVDLILCGHAHGGLIRIPFTDGLFGPGMEFLPEHTNGLYSLSGTDMVVSRGLGNHTGLPRIFNRPHIPVAVLRAE